MMVKKLALAGLLAAAPGFAMADGIAASLSASFGTNPGVAGVGENLLGNGGGLQAQAIAPTSVSVSAAAGAYATASAVATQVSSGALAAGSDAPIIAGLEYSGTPDNAYAMRWTA